LAINAKKYKTAGKTVPAVFLFTMAWVMLVGLESIDFRAISMVHPWLCTLKLPFSHLNEGANKAIF